MRFATLVAYLTAAGVVNASPAAVIRAPPADKAYSKALIRIFEQVVNGKC